MSKFRLLAIDIDGTLVNVHDEISLATRTALRAAESAGIRIILATGRRYGRALPIVRALELDLPLITASGALIKHPQDHRTIYQADLPRETLTRVLQVIDESGYEAILYADTFAEGFDFYCARIEVASPELGEFFTLNAGYERLWPELIKEPPHGVFGGFAMGTREQMLELEQRLQSAVPGELYTHVIRSPKYQGFMCEIAPSGVTKWSAIVALAHRWRIEVREICAVGDDVNDIPMIVGAGLGVAMENADEEVRAVADRIAPANHADGLVEVVRWLLE